MPELVENGPDIPVELMNLLDDGKVVFFCGAGVSMSTGLPSFAGLVDDIYKAAHLEPDEIESEALDLREPKQERRRPKFDKVLGLLERKQRLGSRDPQRSGQLRAIVAKRLAERSKGALHVHRALVELSRTTDGIRLITTNFDNRFKSAGVHERLIDTCPKLPVPKPRDWHSLVHLHGRIGLNDGGRNLILTAADFGRAYLTERWASRFITELFREFTVVFVGYSLDDPVMSYMVDALAAERSRGAKFNNAYAFAGYHGDVTAKQRTIDVWKAIKNVDAIPYVDNENHKLLNETLIEWARIRKDPFAARTQIALNEINKYPNDQTDPVVMRVIWSLQDPVAAKALAQSPSITDEREFPKVSAWLDTMNKSGLLSRSESPHKDENCSDAPLVTNGFQGQQTPNVDQATRDLAVWIAKHIHIPQVLEFVARNGGGLHPVLRDLIQKRLAEPKSELHRELRLLWTVLINQSLYDPSAGLWLSGHYEQAVSEAERNEVAGRAIELLAPRLRVKPGPSSELAFRRIIEHDQAPVPPVQECAHLELFVGDSYHRDDVKELIAQPAVLASHAELLTIQLEQAVDLLAVAGESVSFWDRPSIAPHEQNRDRAEWLQLVDWVRDSYFALIQTNRKSAENLLNRWAVSDRLLLRRLALNAITEDSKASIRLTFPILLKGRPRGLWDDGLRREVLRFLRKAGKRIPRDFRLKLIRAIQIGPPRGKKKPEAWEPEYNRREIGLRLLKLQEAGVRLNKAATELARQFDDDHSNAAERQDEFLSWHGGVRSVSREEHAPVDLLSKEFSTVADVLRDGSIDLESFEGLALQQTVKCAHALGMLGREGLWPSHYWQRFLWAISGLEHQAKVKPGLRVYVALLLSFGPDHLFGEVGPAAAGFVEKTAKALTKDREPLISRLWHKAWGGIGHDYTVGSDDSLTEALNSVAGKLAEAALHRMWKYEPAASQGLPHPTLSYFNAVILTPHGHLGRVMLATRLYQLFFFDPEWTEQNLISRLVPVTSQEVQDLWSAYGWSATMSPNLLAAVKGSFLTVLQFYESLGRASQNLLALFVDISLSAPGTLSSSEIRSVVASLPESGLVVLVNRLRKRLAAKDVDPKTEWEQNVGPWFEKYWPSSAEKNTPTTSNVIVRMLLSAGEAFPEAVNWGLVYLRPAERVELHALRKSDYPRRYPNATFKMLLSIVDQNLLKSWEKGWLREILDTIKETSSDFKSDPAFQQLYRVAAS